MSYVITDPCIDTKDTSCVEVCPVDCIHPTKDDSDFSERIMLFIDPDTCIDCGACEPVCPVSAIYPSEEEVPASQKEFIEINALYYQDADEANGRAQEHQKNCTLCGGTEAKDRREAHK